jgi:hypothetical protein
MPREGFEPTIPVFERANTVHALDRSASVVRLDTNHYNPHKSPLVVTTQTSRSLVTAF